MKRLINIIFIILLIASCKSPEKLISKGEYDEAIKVLIKKITKQPEDTKNILLLRHANTTVNKIDLDSIVALKRTGQPWIWYDVFTIYSQLERRQEELKVMPENILADIDFIPVSYEGDIKNAREKAASYLYAHAKSHMDEEGRENARKAYEELFLITTLYQNYKDTDDLMRHALVMGTNYILVKLENNTGSPLPSFLRNILSDLDLEDYEKRFLVYDLIPAPGREYAFTLLVGVTEILVAPARSEKNTYTESKKIPDTPDNRGNRQIDSNSDTTKKPADSEKFKLVSCEIIDVRQSKFAIINGYVDYQDNLLNKIIFRTPIQAEAEFSHLSTVVTGNLKACSEQVLARIGSQVIPFPSNDELVREATGKFRDIIKGTIWNKEYLVE